MSQLSVVTGGGGFVGRHLVASLLERGDRVRVLDISEPAESDAEFLKTDITDAKAVLDAIEGADCVFHNASLVHTKQNKADFVRQMRSNFGMISGLVGEELFWGNDRLEAALDWAAGGRG